MTRLCIVVEGDSEQVFVTSVLGPHLSALGVFTEARLIANKFDRAAGVWHKGGGSTWAKWRNDLTRLLASDRGIDRRVTTMFDFYRLPKDAPGVAAHREIADTSRRIDLIEESMTAEIGDARFLPYLQRHEFETLVLAGIAHLDQMIDPSARRGLQKLREEIAAIPPEDIDDGVETAPSKRLAKHIADYRKMIHSVGVVERAGLPTLRATCPRFDAWVTRLETLS